MNLTSFEIVKRAYGFDDYASKQQIIDCLAEQYMSNSYLFRELYCQCPDHPFFNTQPFAMRNELSAERTERLDKNGTVIMLPDGTVPKKKKPAIRKPRMKQLKLPI